MLTQAIAAFGFFRLFRRVDDVAAGAITAFGLVNSAAVTVGTMFSATALQTAVRDGEGAGLSRPG